MKISSLQKGLVGHWKLSESSFNFATKRFTDSSPYENHGTGNGTQLGGSPTFQADRMGQPDMSAPFNGSDDYIEIPWDEALKVTDKLTAGAWVKPTNNTDVTKGIIGQTDDSPYNWILRQNANHFEFRAWVGGAQSIASNSILIPGIWQHILASVNNSNEVKIYINGELDKTETGSFTSLYAGDMHTLIGKYDTVTAEYFNGLIDDVYLYNRVLSQEEITLLYESYHPGVRI